MRPIPNKHRKIINEDTYYMVCARFDGNCDGRITIEHAIIYAGKQISEMWNYVPLCERHHGVGKYLGSKKSLLDKRENERIALRRATDEDLAKYPNRDWNKMKRNLGI